MLGRSINVKNPANAGRDKFAARVVIICLTDHFAQNSSDLILKKRKSVWLKKSARLLFYIQTIERIIGRLIDRPTFSSSTTFMLDVPMSIPKNFCFLLNNITGSCTGKCIGFLLRKEA